MDKSILPCIATDEDAAKFQSFGLNLKKTCEISDLQSLPNTYFDIFVLTYSGAYSEVFWSNSRNFYKRYYPERIRQLQMNFKSAPPLTVPFLTAS